MMDLFNLRKSKSDFPRKKDGLALTEVHATLNKEAKWISSL